MFYKVFVFLFFISAAAAAQLRPGVYQIRSVAFVSQVVDVSRVGKGCVLWKDTEGPSQRWSFQSTGSGAYHIRNVETGDYVVVDNSVPVKPILTLASEPSTAFDVTFES